MSTSLPLEIMLLYKGASNVFFETGTHYGATVQTAIDAGFEFIYSVELNHDLFEREKQHFINYPNVIIMEGDSVTVMQEVLPTIKQPIMFWLDAHYNENTPILKEIETIGECCTEPVTILADDMRLMGTSGWSMSTIALIIIAVKKVNVNFEIVFEPNPHHPQDILVAFMKGKANGI